jgi:uncharacterized protein with FMN-binding domain
MTHTSLKRRALPLTFAAVAASSVLSSSPTLAATSTKSVTYKGPTVDFRWGTVQVSIVVKSKKITNVKATYDVHSGRSEFITGDALPLLKQEVLQAQSADIDGVSRATDTSEAYIESLHGAVKKAKKAKAIK